MSWIVIAALIVALLGGGGSVYVSSDALPGDALYPLKTAAEAAQLALSRRADARLYPTYVATRVSELERLRAANRFEDMDRATDRLERDWIRQALEQARGNKAEAARILKVDYSTLHRKLKRHGMDESV